MQVLVDILKEQLEGYSDLLELAKNKQGALLANDIKKLEEINKKEEGKIWELTKLENKRLMIIATLKETFGENLETLTLKEIAQKAPEPYQEEFEKIFVRLNEKIAQLSKINDQNSELIKQSLEIINFTLQAIVRSESEVTYGEQDRKTGQQASRILDTKV